ncbi:GNAT superfamily N-acetyltransferase [Actinoalloteichus hoggarensis]|uniref:Acetyltransferase (GNAT) family protein n=1 Tax=Actinoalloteichus hoggarensis TaxID=1470176 RepID=A0A221W710_9PSEU|nr:GNAT family N-acetyltransferase [Actinoalloteichus hoggarensis]ASO21665.1 Acetyltransferase (GNAT) family protein [Actinoalloteichus hoggarensis]MBB5922258.1 GNAT superfamily N-acetyltransferase [Actinoalloteichus hoggarensis]
MTTPGDTLGMISEAATDDSRRDVLDLLTAVAPGTAPDTVPMTELDELYAPVVLRYHDPETGRLLGAALSCRAQIAVGGALQLMAGKRLPRELDFGPVLDRHSQLQRLAVLPEARGQGIGGLLLTDLSRRLRDRGVRVWFGRVAVDQQTEPLRGFLARHGFTVLEDGAPLPMLLGRHWRTAESESTAFHFYRRLAPAED